MNMGKDTPPGVSPISGTAPPVATRWKKGQSGNPGGRPKGKSLVALMREVLDREHQDRPLSEVLAERIIKEALSGKHPFVKEVLDRLEGPVNQKHEGDKNGPLIVMMQVPGQPPREAGFSDIEAAAMREAGPDDIRAAMAPRVREATADDIRAAALGPQFRPARELVPDAPEGAVARAVTLREYYSLATHENVALTQQLPTNGNPSSQTQ